MYILYYNGLFGLPPKKRFRALSPSSMAKRNEKTPPLGELRETDHIMLSAGMLIEMHPIDFWLLIGSGLVECICDGFVIKILQF